MFMIPADDVLAVIESARRYGRDRAVASRFHVAERTVRRWKRTGLPLNYGRTNISREQWEEFAREFQPRRKPVRVDRQVSARILTDKCRRRA